MRITIFGATGNVGRHSVAEALHRGHDVTAVTRCREHFEKLHPDARHRVGHATQVEDVVALSRDQDLVISATRPATGRESELVDTARTLLAGLSRTRVRLLLVGGAGSLVVPGSNGRTVRDDPTFAPPPAADPLVAACGEQLDVCRADDSGVDWVYLSPAAELVPGERTGTFRHGRDELLVDADGRSRISMPDLAMALLDEAEHPAHHRARFTIGY